MKYTCPDCGTEYELYTPIGRVYKDNRCSACHDKAERAEAVKRALSYEAHEDMAQHENWKKQCGLNGLYQDKTFDNFDRVVQPTAYDVCKNWNGKSIILLSPDCYGVGKTHLVAALANHLINHSKAASIDEWYHTTVRRLSCPVYFINETVMLSAVRETYNHDFDRHEEHQTENMLFKAWVNYPLLIIDDVGKVRPRDYGFLQGVYYRIIDERYSRQRPVVLTTNLNLEQLESHIGGACADRLVEMAGDNVVIMSGESYRTK